MGHQINKFMYKALLKDKIQDVDYNPMIYGLYMMNPPAIIEKVRVKISKCGKKLKRKSKVQEDRNDSTTLGYI